MALDIRATIRNAFVIAGSISDYEEVDGNKATAALDTLNRVLGQLNTDQLFSFSMEIVDHTVASNTRELTIGATGNIVAERPAFINAIVYMPSAQSSGIPLLMTDLPTLIGGRSNSSGTPSYFAYNPTLDNGKIYFNCHLVGGSLLSVVYNKTVPVVTIDTQLNVTADQDNLILYALAREIAVREKAPSLNVERIDKLYMDAINRTTTANGRNQVPLLMLPDAGDIQSGRGLAPWL